MLKNIVSAREGIWHQLFQRESLSRSKRWQMDTPVFGWEAGRVQRRRAGNGWMVGIGVFRKGKYPRHALVIVSSEGQVESGILTIVLIPGLLSVPTLQTGDQEFIQ